MRPPATSLDWTSCTRHYCPATRVGLGVSSWLKARRISSTTRCTAELRVANRVGWFPTTSATLGRGPDHATRSFPIRDRHPAPPQAPGRAPEKRLPDDPDLQT